jgi:hypothetical protein
MKYSGKKIVSAGIIRNMDFDTEYDRDDYIEKLNNKGIEYEILHLYLVDENGKYGLVTLEQYNNCPLYDISLERS